MLRTCHPDVVISGGELVGAALGPMPCCRSAEVELAALGDRFGEPLPDTEQPEPVRAGPVFTEDESADPP